VRLYAIDGRFRTYNQQNEDEAYGCAIAALVPFAGLQDMLARGTHICRIAEHFVVPVSVVEERVAATSGQMPSQERSHQIWQFGAHELVFYGAEAYGGQPISGHTPAHFDVISMTCGQSAKDVC
jgi:hypothetical protein